MTLNVKKPRASFFYAEFYQLHWHFGKIANAINERTIEEYIDSTAFLIYNYKRNKEETRLQNMFGIIDQWDNSNPFREDLFDPEDFIR